MTERSIDLAAKRLGGMVVEANDEFFAAKEHLVLPEAPVFHPHRYTDRGKEMDGWETRRRRGVDLAEDDPYDWAIVRLGVPGVVRSVVVDTSFFRGNNPASTAVDGRLDDSDWVELVPRNPLQGDHRNTFTVEDAVTCSAVRLRIFPDGGIARLRVHGDPLPDLRALVDPAGRAELAGTLHGGRIEDCSDAFFSSPHNLLAPGDAVDMGDGWETRRRRGRGHDWVVVRLAAEARVEHVEVLTTHFKGNYPDRAAIDVGDGQTWQEVIAPTPLAPHDRRRLAPAEPAVGSHVRLRIFPDGGVARLRVHGQVTEDGWDRFGAARLDALPRWRAEADLLACCGSRRWAEQVAAGRPYGGITSLRAAAERAADALEPADWLEAFAAHPRIGERTGGAWSRREQASASGADQAVLEALVAGNRAYEERFGHVFLIYATGKSADEMLAALQERLGNDPATELKVAAEQQREITALRIHKLCRPEGVAT